MTYKPFKDAIKERNKITKRELRNIRKIYNEWAREIRAEANRLRKLGTSSTLQEERALAKLYYELRNASKQITAEIDRSVRNGASDIGDVLVRTNKRWLESLGLSTNSFEYKFSNEKRRAINKVLTGSIYKNFQGLNPRIWKITQGHEKDIYNIIARGMLEDKSIYEIAKDIEKYVNPKVRFPWSKIYKDPTTGKIYSFPVGSHKIDYNAQRLVRTTLQHVYQEVLVEMTKDNPFVKGYLWIAAGSHPCQLCLDRDGTIYTAANLPLDHPNGMCDIEPVIDKEKAMEDIKGFYENPVYYPKIQRFTDKIEFF